MGKYAKGGFISIGSFIDHHDGRGEAIVPFCSQKANISVSPKIIAKDIANEINKHKERAKNGGIF